MENINKSLDAEKKIQTATDLINQPFDLPIDEIKNVADFLMNSIKDLPAVEQQVQSTAVCVTMINKSLQRMEELAAEIVAAKVGLKEIINEAVNETITPISNETKKLTQNFKGMKHTMEEFFKAQSLDQQLQIANGDYGIDLNCDCTLYFSDPADKGQLYTVDKAGDKVKIFPEDNSVISSVLNSQEGQIINDTYGVNIGDGKTIPHNAMVVPILTPKSSDNSRQEVAVIAVCRDKANGFTNADMLAVTEKPENKAMGSSFTSIYSTKNAMYDKMTGLPSRAGIARDLPTTIKSVLEGNKHTVAVMDIDYFKKVNDTYGHNAGDAVLKQFSDTAKEVFKDDVVARWGGEEFVVIIKGDEDKAFDKLEHFRTTLQETPMPVGDGKEIFKTASIGCKEINPDNYRFAKEDKYFDRFEKGDFDLADKLTYDSKVSGRNQTQATNETMVKRFNRENDDFTINYCDVKSKVEEIYNTPSLLHENNMPIASMSFTNKDGLTVETSFKVQGNAVLEYKGEIYKNPSEYTKELKDLLQVNNLKDISVITPNNYIIAYSIADKDNNEVSTGNKIWKEEKLMLASNSMTRKELIDVSTEVLNEYAKSNIEYTKSLATDKTVTANKDGNTLDNKSNDNNKNNMNRRREDTERN